MSISLEISFATPLIICGPEHAVGIRAITTLQIGALTFKGENMEATMTTRTHATCSVEWKDAGGNTVKVDPSGTKWESSDDTIVQVTVATGNSQIANLYAPGPTGKAQVQATADADLGEGVKSVTAILDVQVISGEAVGGEIKFSQSPAQGGPEEASGAGRARR